MSRVLKGLFAAVVILSAAGCAPRIVHHAFSDDEVGMAAFQEENVKKVALGPEVQGYVASYPIFAETVNQYVLKDTSGYVARYNVYAREPITFPRTDLPELDAFLLRAYKASATVRVGTRLMGLVGARLAHLDDKQVLEGAPPEGYETFAPAAMAAAVQAVQERKGVLNREQRQAIAKDVIALVAAVQTVQDASQQAKGLITEGENLKQMLSMPSYLTELKAKDAGKAELLPEIISNLNGAIAGLRSAESDGASMTRNARVWKLYLVNAIQ